MESSKCGPIDSIQLPAFSAFSAFFSGMLNSGLCGKGVTGQYMDWSNIKLDIYSHTCTKTQHFSVSQ